VYRNYCDILIEIAFRHTAAYTLCILHTATDSWWAVRFNADAWIILSENIRSDSRERGASETSKSAMEDEDTPL
jgi:hypothetical protein